jgi:hypothetical protein
MPETLNKNLTGPLDVLSMAEMVAAIIVVCLPALRSLIRRVETHSSKTGATSNKSHGKAYKNYAMSTGHIKLSSGRDAYVTSTNVATVGPSGSEVELQDLPQGRGGIYKTERVSVSSLRREDIRS